MTIAALNAQPVVDEMEEMEKMRIDRDGSEEVDPKVSLILALPSFFQFV